jgi:hypothetical protein
MAKVKRGTTITRTSATPLAPGVPAAAPLRPPLTALQDEAETAAARANNPHATGADRVPVLKAHLTAAQTRAAHERATGKRAPVKPVAKAVVKPAAKVAPKAAVKPATKAAKKKSAAQPAATETY